MDQVSSEKKARQDLIQTILEYGNKAFNPGNDVRIQLDGQQAFDELLKRLVSR
jgi:hypothetical protein